MTTRFSESRVDHRGDPLPEGVYALVTPRGEVVSYKARWREQDDNGVVRQRSKSFSGREFRSLERARVRAIEQRDGATAIVRTGATVLRADSAARLTIGELFKEWITHYAAHNTGERYARDSVRTWDKHVEPRLGQVTTSPSARWRSSPSTCASAAHRSPNRSARRTRPRASRASASPRTARGARGGGSAHAGAGRRAR
jgi:hypothetical protein